MNNRRTSIMIALTLIVAAVVLRIMPHPANFAPVAAVAIFGGAVLPRKFALWVPLAAMAASDMVIGFYSIMPVIWACYFLIALASSLWLQKPNLVKGAVLTLGASVGFFVITNFAVWATSGMYDHTLAGLGQCYVMALPFFRNTLLSDAAYTSALFAAYSLTRASVPSITKAIRRGA